MEADIWGDQQVSVSGLPLPLTSVASKKILALGMSQIQDLWDVSTQSWKPAEVIFPDPSLRLRNNYRDLLAKLKLSGEFEFSQSRYLYVLTDSTDLILDSEADLSQAFFTINMHRRNILSPMAQILLQQSTTISATVPRHRGKANKFTLHSYDDAPHLVCRIAGSTWQTNDQLHQAQPRQLRLSRPYLGLRMARVRVSRWIPRGNINLRDSSRWTRLWNSMLS